MNINQLIEFLTRLQQEEKGYYKIVNDGYLNEVKLKDITIDDKNKEVIL